MKKECQVILLPTKNILDNGRQPYLSFNKMRLVFPVTGAEGRRLRQRGIINPSFTPQHLYICSNEEIKEGEYGINKTTGSIFKVLKKNKAIPKVADNNWWDVEWITGGNISNTLIFFEGTFADPVKIIATTDNSLTFEREINSRIEKGQPFPAIPQSFIDNYISEYNKGNIITSVMVEYEGLCKYSGEHYPCDCKVLKLNDNEIVISQEEDKNLMFFNLGVEYESLLRRGFKKEAKNLRDKYFK